MPLTNVRDAASGELLVVVQDVLREKVFSVGLNLPDAVTIRLGKQRALVLSTARWQRTEETDIYTISGIPIEFVVMTPLWRRDKTSLPTRVYVTSHGDLLGFVGCETQLEFYTEENTNA